ncbi:MAG: glycogen synthase GlgA [Clostridia bacterium]|nr:glycogen synthase GlgA [Clostridia bacterium]
MKVLFASSEAVPFMASGGLGDVAGALPKALRRRLIGCRVVMPFYSGIKDELKENATFLTSFSVPVAWRRQYCGVFEAKHNGVIYYLIDNQYYFKRDGIYGYYDDAERFAFFARAVLEMIQYIDWKPDVIHCNDWQTALTPVYYSKLYAQAPGYENIKTVFTIHNIQYQGVYGIEILEDVVGIPYDMKAVLEYDNDINFVKGAIECANVVTTVSPTYANEILDPWYSHGLDTILKQRSWKLRGILNGIDTVSYDPETDKDIFANYNSSDFSNKAVNKAELQKMFGLPVKADVPTVGIVSRLVAHKGFDLIKAVFDELLSNDDLQVFVLGSGEWQYESYFKELKERFPDKIGLRLGFVPDLARKIYAASDIFLMPSKSEPCGLSQMVALRYGAIPIVRETGGLKDTVFDSGDNMGNGFTFCTYNAHDMLHAIRRALEGYKDKEGWNILVKRAMECDNSWAKSAGEYIKMYNELKREQA